MKAEFPKRSKKAALIHGDTLTLAYIKAVREAIAKNDGMVMGTLDRATKRAVFELVFWACRSVLAGGIVLYLTWFDAGSEALYKILEMLGYK